MSIFFKKNILDNTDDGLYPIEDETNDAPVYEDNEPTAANIENNSVALELKVVKPDRYNNVKQIADHLIARRTVVLNLEAANKETAKRLLDFLSGVAYSIGGQLKRVASNTFVITPSNVDVSGDQMRPAATSAATEESQNKFTTTYGLSSAGDENINASMSDTII